MRERTIKRVRDLLDTSQQRVTVTFVECPHVLSLTELDLRAVPVDYLDHLRSGCLHTCPHCPDATPEESREEKSASQLWKEAGEP